MSRLAGLLAASSLVALVSSASAQVQGTGLGPVSITGDQTLHVHLLGQSPASPPTPVWATVVFSNADGEILADAGGVCEGLCFPVPVSLATGVVTTVAIAGSNLGIDPGDSMTVQPWVSVPAGALSHLRASIEVIGATTPFRTAIQYEPIALTAELGLPQTRTVGPLTLAQGEYARLTATNRVTGGSDVRMFFLDAAGIRIGSDTFLRISYTKSASIELQPTAERAVISGGATTFGPAMDVTIEILDAATNAVKATLTADGGTGQGGGTGKGGGGGGSL